MYERKNIWCIVWREKKACFRKRTGWKKNNSKKQIALLQDYYKKDGVRNQVKEAFATLLAKWDREDAAFSLAIHYRYTNIHNRT